MNPDPLQAAMDEVFPTQRPAFTPAPAVPPEQHDDSYRRRAAAWCSKAMAGKTSDLAAMPPDSGRNHALNKATFVLLRYSLAGHLDPNTVTEAMRDAALTSGLGNGEIEATLASAHRSALRHGPLEPPIGASDDSTPSGEPPGGIPDPFDGLTIDPNTGEVLPPVEIIRTSWWPRDIGPILRGEADPEAPPALLARDDGQHLFYPGKLNGLIGESESGKTWVALLAVAQELAAGRHVTYIDCEDSDRGIITRLRMLGVTDSQLELLAYIGPDDALGAQAARDLFEHLADHQPALIILDGYNAAMTMLGLNLLDNMDIYKFALTLLRPLKNTGAAVIFVDHVTKSKEGRGMYAIGAQAKRADVDGCALSVEVVQPFGKGAVGKLRLTVSKDRAGYVRGASTGSKNAGTVTIDSTTGDDIISMSISAPDLRPKEERGAFRPTVLMQRVSHFLATTQGPVSQVAIKKGVSGNEAALLQAAEVLVEEGYASRGTGPRSSITYTHARPYYESVDQSVEPFDEGWQ
jgi:hypothetical protein